MKPQSFPTPHSCPQCRKLILSLRRKEGADMHGPETSMQQQIRWMSSVIEPRYRHLGLRDATLVVFDLTLGELIRAAVRGCRLCYWMVNQAGEEIVLRRPEDLRFAAKLTGRYVYFGVVDVGEGGMSEDEAVDESFERVSPTLQLVADADNPAAIDVPTRPVNTNPSSAQSFNLARRWLKTCLETHEKCPKPGDFMPTRLVEISKVGGKRLIRLREKRNFEGRVEAYAAVSYCWGDKRNVETTSAVLPSHLFGIDFQGLPATIRDAIVVAEELNIRLLWVDTLCIVQDDEDDKESEIALMPLIYSQATVTITASRASNVQEGFLQKRPLMGREAPGAVFKLPFQSSDSNAKVGHVIVLPPTDEVIEPLDHRGWTMQERFLSRRILEYGTHQTRWTCQQYMNSDAPTDGFQGNRVYNNKRSDYLFVRGLEIVMTEADTRGIVDAEITVGHVRTWHHLLRTYTDRSLSLSTDRLPGFSGIAALFATVLQDTYCAGLWKSRLASDLLWARSYVIPAKMLPRPTEYQGPSWSWAGMNGPVQEAFPLTDEVADNDFQVIDFQAHSRGKVSQTLYGQFGAVSSAKLIISGRVQIADLTICPKDAEAVQIHFPRKRSDGPVGTLPVKVKLDCIEQDFATPSFDHLEVFLLKILATHDGAQGLLLRRTRQGEYSRLGIFTFGYMCGGAINFEGFETGRKRYERDFAWLGQGDVRTITLV